MKNIENKDFENQLNKDTRVLYDTKANLNEDADEKVPFVWFAPLIMSIVLVIIAALNGLAFSNTSQEGSELDAPTTNQEYPVKPNWDINTDPYKDSAKLPPEDLGMDLPKEDVGSIAIPGYANIVIKTDGSCEQRITNPSLNEGLYKLQFTLEWQDSSGTYLPIFISPILDPGIGCVVGPEGEFPEGVYNGRFIVQAYTMDNQKTSCATTNTTIVVKEN